jgi:benzylsuccinate CoA-transferase BbsF subunit/naphthyl-2-methylsuccinate CoA transferase subunit
MVPSHTLFGIMAALMYRKKTGKGQTVEVAQAEASISMKPTDIMTYVANGTTEQPNGYHDRHAAPHGIYKVIGHRKWIAITVFNDAEWEELKKYMGNPKWAVSDKFKTLEDRLQNQEELDQGIEDWTKWQYGETLFKQLMEKGVKAGLVYDGRNMVEDEALRERGFFANLDHSVVGITLYNRFPMIFSKTPIRMETSAPLIGQHTEDILVNFLGYSKEEVEQFDSESVLV